METIAHGTLKSDLNVTPMIDVLLVLLIIFMIITPATPTGLDALVPPSDQSTASTPRNDIVITVLGDQAVRINDKEVILRDLEAQLATIFKSAANQVIFVRGDKSLEYRPVAEVLDIVRGVGFGRVALLTH